MPTAIRERISVIVPVRNKAPILRRCLGSIVQAARLDGQVELIFVDNQSTDGSECILSSDFGEHAVLLSSTASNAAGVRNQGVRAASGGILCFLDADCVIPLDYFGRLREVFSHEWIAATGCAVDLPTDKSWVERVWYTLHHRGIGGIRTYLNSGNFAVRAGVFDRMGGFDESLETGEDSNLGERLTSSGHRIVESSALRVLHIDNPTNLVDFFRKEVWHAKGMMGSAGFGHIDKPLALSILHLFLILLALGWTVAAGFTRNPSFLAFAVASLLIVPLMSVSYRRVLARTTGSVVPSLVLYQTYFLARVVALLGLLFKRGGAARRVKV
jgi:glycosyltransferase involved in cell wall biosynthesis